MYFIRFLWPELIGAVPAWNTHSHHVFIQVGDDMVITIWYEESVSILLIPTFHFSLSFPNLVIICGAFEFNAEASILFVIICYNGVRLSFHISFAPSVDTFFWCILVLTKPGSHDSLRIKTPDVLHFFALKIGFIFYFKHIQVVWIVKQIVLPIFSDWRQYLGCNPMLEFFSSF